MIVVTFSNISGRLYRAFHGFFLCCFNQLRRIDAGFADPVPLRDSFTYGLRNPKFFVMVEVQTTEATSVAGDLIADLLGRGLEVRVRVTGGSMRPLLRGGELATVIRVPPRSLRRGDLVLWRSVEGGLLLHRVLRVSGEGEDRRCWTRGDALVACDEPFGADQILGRVVRVEGLRLPAAPAAADTRSGSWRLASGCCLALARLALLSRRVRGRIARSP